MASARIFILLLALIWLIESLKRKELYVSYSIQSLLVFSFLFFSAFSLFYAQNLGWAGRKMLFLFSIFPIYLVAADIFRDPERRIKVIKFLVWGAGIAAAIGIVQFISQFIIGLDNTAHIWRNYVTPLFLGKSFTRAVLEYPSWLVNIGGHNYLRAFSTFPDPHMFSFYLGLTLPLAIGLYHAFKKNIYLIFSLIILLADLLTFSRGGYIGLIAGTVFILIYFAINKKINSKKLLASFVLMLVVFVSLAFTPVGKRAITSFNVSEGSNKGRFENWAQAVEIIKNYPQGVGIGNYSYEIEPSADYRKPIYAHNLYLDIAAETGVISAIIFGMFLVFAIRALITRSKNNILYLGGAVGLIIFSVHSIFDTALYSVQVLPLLLIIISLSAINAKEFN